MDVLFGSIDVRDLLSSQDLEESSPLSAPDLRLLIDRLQIRSLDIKEKVRSYLLSHHSDFSHIFSLSSHSFSQTLSLSDDVSALLRLLSDRSLDLDIRHLADDIRRNRLELDDRREALQLLLIVSDLIRRLSSAREDLTAGSVIEAAKAVRDLKKSVPDPDEREPKLYGFLREEWLRCFDEVQEVLARAMGNAVVFEEENRRLRVTFRSRVGETEGVELSTVLTAMDIVGVLDYGLAKVADLMIKYVIIPTIRDGSSTVLVEAVNQNSEQKDEAILSLVSSSDFQVDCLNGAAIFSRLIQVIKFIYEFIFFCNGTWMCCFGRLTWPRISELVIADLLSKAVPDDASKVAEFQNIIKLTTEFETGLKEMMFISPTDNKDDKLSAFAQNVEVHFASRKKNEILAKARNLLLQSEFVLSLENLSKGRTYYTPEVAEKISVHSVDLLFKPERCLVSEAASNLMELVHQTLQGVHMSSSRVAMEFYHAARDALLLYEAIVPVKVSNISGADEALNGDIWMVLSSETIRGSVQPICLRWLEEELSLENKKQDKAVLTKMFERLKGDDTILKSIKKLGKEDLYADLLFFLRFGSLRPDCHYDSKLLTRHGVEILEDLVINLAEGITSMYLELISVDSNMSSEMSRLDLVLCSLSTRALQRLRNEVALNQWLHQNIESVVSMYEDRFDMFALQTKLLECLNEKETDRLSWWKKIAFHKPTATASPLRYIFIRQMSLPVKRTKELRALSGWRYYFSLFLEFSDITMPLVRAVVAKVSSAVSFFLVCLIGRSLGLIYTGIRQALGWRK